MNTLRICLGIGLMATFTACSVGPNYRQPKVAMPGDWSESGSGGTTNATAHLRNWGRSFQDPVLDSLIERAVKANLDLRAAEARVRAARAVKGAVLADFLPTLDATGSYTKTRRSKNPQTSSSTNSVFDTDTYLLGFDASWEIDVFGGKRRAFEAAAVNLAAIEDVENALVSHGNERERHRTLGEAVVASQRAVELANQRYTKGVGDFLNVGVAQRALNQAEDDLVDSQRTVSQNLVALYKALGGGWESGTMTSQR